MPLFSTFLRGALLLLVVSLTACTDAPLPEPEPEAEPVPFIVLGLGQSARLDTTEQVLRTADAWQAVRDSLRPAAPFDSVNFEENMLLLAAVPVTAGGYSVVFERVTPTDSSLVARYVLSEPADDCTAPPAQVVPFQVIEVPQTDAPVTFERRREEYPCTQQRRVF